MSEEDIRHIYCDGEECCESIDGYNPHAKDIDNFIADDLKKQGERKMLDIRFRAWDTENNCYLEHGFDFRIDGDGHIYRRTWGESIWDRAMNLISEQFTGLKDKNREKADIYAGDVFRGEESGWLFTVEFQKGKYILTKKVDYAPYRVTHADLHYALNNLAIKYVGNIHQNPELLEQE
ncbi:MAG: hypothetical protein KAS32_07570 [Candidatus Peribacteraceae bacterium]|nr:hypothetical protein [Candidatus Peribacteraceae bacterium]